MKKIILSLLSLTIGSCFSQQNICTFDGTDGSIVQNPKVQTCGYNSDIYTQSLALQETWTATLPSEKKTLNYRIHIMQDNLGGNNWQNDPATLSRFDQINSWINLFYSNIQDHSMSIAGVADIDDAQFGFNLVDVHFYQDDVMNQTSSQAILQNYITTNFPERNDAMHVFITDGSFGNATGYAYFPNLGDFPASNANRSIWTSKNDPNEPVDYFLAQHLAHEFGHTIDLRHTYNHEFCQVSHPDYLDDVFIENFPGVTPDPGCDVAYYDPTCDLNDPAAYCTNNLMSGKGLTKYYISPNQIGRIHRVARFDATREFIWGYSSVPYNITSDQTWDFSIKMYEDLIIKSGNTLTVTCEIQMVPEASIMIEPGATLVLDGGRITSAKGAKNGWRGIQVWGNHNLNQYGSQNQGKLITKNGAIIENAYNAVKVWKSGDWSSTGGVLDCRNTTFKNNWRSVEYRPYRNFTNNGNEVMNRGVFNNCVFEWNEDYFLNGLVGGISMNYVNGVKVLGCDFIDYRETITENEGRPYGIFALDAGFKVSGINNGGLSNVDEFYSDDQFDIGNFTNLNQGIYVGNSYSELTTSIDHIKFTDCSFGIELRGLESSSVTRNNFIHSENHPADINYIYGLILDNSNFFQVEGNIFDRTSDIPHGFTGIYTKDSGKEQNVIYRNVFNDLNVANYATGVNSDNEPSSSSGLQWLCNEYNNSNEFDQFDEAVGQNHGVRNIQGQYGVDAGNKFSTSLSVYPEIQFESTSNYNKIYFQSSTTANPLLTYSNNIGVNYQGETNTCLTSFREVGEPKSLNLITKNKINQFKMLSDSLDSIVSLNLASTRNSQNMLLVTSLNSMNLTTRKNEFENMSPYMNDEMLRSIGQNSAYPQNDYYNLLLANVETASTPEFLYFLYDNQIIPNQLILNLLTHSESNRTEYGDLFYEITNLTEEIERLSFSLLEDLEIDSLNNNSDDAEIILLKKDYLYKSELVDNYLTTNPSKSDSLINELSNDITDYDSLTQAQMNDFIVFKSFQKSLFVNGYYQVLDSVQLDSLKFYSENLTGRAQVQAQNILCFYTGDCANYEMNKNKSVSKKRIPIRQLIQSDHTQFTVYPNPNLGEFSIKTDKTIIKIEVFDMNGNLIDLSKVNIYQNLIKAELPRSLSNGIYFVTIIDNNGEIEKGKVILNR